MSYTEKRSRRHHSQNTQPTQQQEHDNQQQQTTADNTADDQETPVDYLSRNNTTTLVKEAVRVLLANRPDDPLQFLVDFFAPARRVKSVDSAYDRLCWTDYSMPIYQRNILEVYDTLVSMKNEGTRLKGLLGFRFNELLRRLSDDLPTQHSAEVYQRVKRRNDQVISFKRFYHSVLLLHVMKDFALIAQDMHRDLDVQGHGKVSRDLSELVLDRLFASFGQLSESDSELQTLSFEETFSHSFLTNADPAFVVDEQCMNENDFVKACVVRLMENVLR